MAIVLARGLRDGDVIVTGTNAVLPLSACHVARECGKRITVMIGASGTLDPTVDRVPASGADEKFIAGRHVLGLRRGIEDQLRGFVDVIFLGALQIDPHGRCNLGFIGPHAAPRFRGPGTIGVSLLATVHRALFFFLNHDRRTFVDCVDFVSGSGLRQDGGIEQIVTPLGVFAPTTDRRTLALKWMHPGVAIDTIRRNTGWPIDSSGVSETPAPVEAELAALSSNPFASQLVNVLA